jgi:hypothetical protein
MRAIVNSQVLESAGCERDHRFADAVRGNVGSADRADGRVVVAGGQSGSGIRSPLSTTTRIAPAGSRRVRSGNGAAGSLAGLKVNARRRTAKLTWIAVDDVTAASSASRLL